jgi:hypothetical protein
VTLLLLLFPAEAPSCGSLNTNVTSEYSLGPLLILPTILRKSVHSPDSSSHYKIQRFTPGLSLEHQNLLCVGLLILTVYKASNGL